MNSKKSEVTIPLATSFIQGDLSLVPDQKGLIIFAHGSGSSRFSSRNKYVAEILQQGRFSTLLFDLLSREEEEKDLQTREFRFNIPLLAERLILVTKWIRGQKNQLTVPLGYFGASTGAAAALIAAADVPKEIAAVVSRGGRPDLAGAYLPFVKAPALLIIGEHDTEVIALNQSAYNQLSCEKSIEIVPGATHLFEEEGALKKAAQLSLEWFTKCLEKNI